MKAKKPQARDPKKERVFQQLAQILDSHGLTVRREELKRGHGWKVVSGTCRVEGSSLIFVDRRMSHDDQISLLVGKILALQLAPSEEQLAALRALGFHSLTGDSVAVESVSASAA